MPVDITQEFVEDAREHLQAAGQHLVALERNPADAEQLHGLLRRLHTVKGNAGFLDLRSTYELLHAAENMLQSLRESPTPRLTAGMVDLQFRVLDALENILNQLSAGGKDEAPAVGDLVRELIDMEAQAGVTDQPEPEPAAPAAQEAAPDLEAVGSDRLNLDDPADGLDALIAETGGRPRALRKAFEAQEAEMETAGPRTKAAWRLIIEYLGDLHINHRTVSGASRHLLHGLARNLAAWRLQEAPTWGEEAALHPTSDDLSDSGEALRRKIEAMARGGVKRFFFDLRRLDALNPAEIAVLVSLMKKVPDQDRVGLILDGVSQSGLLRVLRVMGLDKRYRLEVKGPEIDEAAESNPGVSLKGRP